MAPENGGFIKGVDELIADTPFDRVTAHYGLPAPQNAAGEYRMECVFHEACRESRYGHLTVNLSSPARVIYCHSCKVRGNLLTLLHGLDHHVPPTGDRLRGDEFKAAVAKLREIAGTDRSVSAPVSSANPASTPPAEDAAGPALINPPLRRHDKEAARALETLYEELITDPAEMTPHAAAYFRRRPWLTPEVFHKWGVGYLPRSGRSLFRGWVVYTQRNERGDVISYSGRDVNFEEKWTQWIRDGRPEGRKPAKHRYVSGYHRGLELYGQQVSRLSEPALAESLQQFGLVVVEGANDVIRLDCLGVAAVGLCSNRATPEQIQKLIRFATQAASRRVVLLPDCDEEGEDGFKDLLWSLNEHGLNVTLGWSRTMHDGAFAGKQPEDLTGNAWGSLSLPLRRD